MGLIHEKTRGKKSHASVLLTPIQIYKRDRLVRFSSILCKYIGLASLPRFLFHMAKVL